MDDRELEAKALAFMFAAGSVLALLSLVVPHGSATNDLGEALIGAAGVPAAVGLVAIGPRLSRWEEISLLVIGVELVSLGVYFGHGGPPAASAAFFYVWVATYAGFFLSRTPAVGLLTLCAGSYAVVLVIDGGPAAPAEWVLAMGSAAVAQTVVGLVANRLRQMAGTDPLTGLGNRSSGEVFLRRELVRAARYATPLAVALFDLDSFKAINDTAGHEAGDEVLRQVATIWREGVRRTDVVFRYGGDEFAVVLPHTTVADAEALMERMARAAPHPCSIGITNTVPGDDLRSVMVRADSALYAAKSDSDRRIATAVA